MTEHREFTVYPAADLLGNAEHQAPGECEERYRPYAEKVRLEKIANE